MILRKLFLFSILVCFAYSSEAISLSKDEKNYLKEKKEITVCTNPKGLPLYPGEIMERVYRSQPREKS